MREGSRGEVPVSVERARNRDRKSEKRMRKRRNANEDVLKWPSQQLDMPTAPLWVDELVLL